MLAPVALGYFIVALAFTNLTRFIGQSIGMVTYPKVAAANQPGLRLRIIRRDVMLATALCGGVTLILVVLVPWLVPLFFGSAFEPAIAAAQLLLVAGFFASVRRVLVDGTRGAGRPMWGAAAEFVTLLAVPGVVIATRYTDSLAVVAFIFAVANFLGLSAVLPALLGVGGNRGSSVALSASVGSPTYAPSRARGRPSKTAAPTLGGHS